MPGCSGLDRIFPEWEQPLFPPLLLGLQVLFMLGAWLVFSWVTDQRLLTLTDFPSFSFWVWLMTVSTLAMDLKTRILESLEASLPVTLATCRWDSFTFSSSFQLLLLLAVKVSCLNLGHGCTVCLCCLLRGKEGVKAWMNPAGQHQASFHPTFPKAIYIRDTSLAPSLLPRVGGPSGISLRNGSRALFVSWDSV